MRHLPLLLAPLLLAAALAGCASDEPTAQPADADAAPTPAPAAAPGAPPDATGTSSAARTERAGGSFVLGVVGPPAGNLRETAGQHFVGGSGDPFPFTVRQGERAVVVDLYWNDDALASIGMQVTGPDGDSEVTSPSDPGGKRHLQVRYPNATAGEWRVEPYLPGPRTLITYQWVVTIFPSPIPDGFDAGTPA